MPTSVDVAVHRILNRRLLQHELDIFKKKKNMRGRVFSNQTTLKGPSHQIKFA
jgi:hypothetical protein